MIESTCIALLKRRYQFENRRFSVANIGVRFAQTFGSFPDAIASCSHVNARGITTTQSSFDR